MFCSCFFSLNFLTIRLVTNYLGCTGPIFTKFSGLVDSTRRCLRSADVSTCWHRGFQPPTFSSYGDRTFAAAGPRLWNALPVQLRNPDITYGLFRRQLKGHLLREASTRRSVISDMRRYKTLTYLLTYLLVTWSMTDILSAIAHTMLLCHCCFNAS